MNEPTLEQRVEQLEGSVAALWKVIETAAADGKAPSLEEAHAAFAGRVKARGRAEAV